MRAPSPAPCEMVVPVPDEEWSRGGPPYRALAAAGLAVETLGREGAVSGQSSTGRRLCCREGRVDSR